tara:strand:+ start:473 stop:1753 length:1281 start_codon:yes stop_codon:yes gene_type:complete
MKKVLIITYYWPPKGGVGVQRWLKLTKYLCKHNCKPVIYTPDNGMTPLYDDSLLESIPAGLKVLKNKICEPQRILSFFTNKKPNSDVLVKTKNSLLNRLLVWFRSNFFIPDSRVFWIKPSIKFLTNYLENNPVDVIISTGPPHSMHLIALSLKKRFNIKWIADFRDPWTGIEYFDKLPFLSFVKKRHQYLEKQVLINTDLVLSVSPSWSNQMTILGAKKTFVLTNGYDPDDYNPQFESANTKSNQFIIGHFGLYNQLRDHSFFWKTIHNITQGDADFLNNIRFLFAGEVHDNFFINIRNYKFDKKLEYYPYLNHSNSIKHMMNCDLLLVTQGQTKSVHGRLPAKLFEYIGSRRPILAIGEKNSDLEKIVSKISYAWFVDFDNYHLLEDTIFKIYELSKLKNAFEDDISSFSREEQVKQLIALIDNL